MNICRRRRRAPVLAVLFFAIGCLGEFLLAEAPQWWTDRGVLQTEADPDNYAVINQGQAKNLFKKAYEELVSVLPAAARQGVTFQELTDFVTNLPVSSDANYTAINNGQLKNGAKKFYAYLNEIGYSIDFPWGNSTQAPDDYALANQGQAKNLFKFDLGTTRTTTISRTGGRSATAWTRQLPIPTPMPIKTEY